MKKIIGGRHGFSLVELVIAIMILFILALIVIPQFVATSEQQQGDYVLVREIGGSVQIVTTHDQFSVRLRQNEFRSHFNDGELYRLVLVSEHHNMGRVLLFEKFSGERMWLTQKQFNGEQTVANFTLIKGGWTGTRPTNTSSNHGSETSPP